MGLRGPRLAILFDDADTKAAARAIAHDVGEVMTEETIRATPRAQDTPPGQHLADRITQTKVRLTGRNTYTSGAETDDEKAPYVEWDTSPHWIHPKDPDGVLVFKGRGGVTVFARSVFHPGTQGHHMFAQGAAAGDRALPRIAAWHMQGIEARVQRRVRAAGSAYSMRQSTFGRWRIG